jgi:hypothetical protein
LRLIRENTLRYQPFFDYLENSEKKDDNKTRLNLVKPTKATFRNADETKLLKIISEFREELNRANTFENLIEKLNVSASQIMGFISADIYLFDESSNNLSPISKNYKEKDQLFLNHIGRNGILKNIIESKSGQVIPYHGEANTFSQGKNYFIYPISSGMISGVLIFSGYSSSTNSDNQNLFLELISGFLLARYELLAAREEISLAYNELQVYQAKLLNDFKLSAVGELTTGIAEELLSPLQVIMSHAELIESSIDASDPQSTEAIKVQVKKVEAVIKGLIKFAARSHNESELKPCSINKIVEDFYSIILSSISGSNYECLLHLEEKLPSVVSNSAYIQQLLASVFTLLKNSFGENGAILIQTKYYKETVIIGFITSDKLKISEAPNEDITLRIIKNIMRKHKGKAVIKMNSSTGTKIDLHFPLKMNMAT